MPLLRTPARALALLLATSACGLGGAGDAPPPAAFPMTGPGPFQLLGSADLPGGDAPNLYLPPGYAVDEPSAAPPRGSQLTIFFTATPTQGGAAPFIAQVTLDGLIQAGALTPVLQADQPWEGGGVRHPTLLLAPPGSGLPPYLLVYQGQDGSVGLATAQGQGDQAGPFHKAAAPLLNDAALTSATAVLRPESGDLVVYSLSADGALHGALASAAALRGFLDSGAAVPWQPLGAGAALLSAADFSVGQRATDLQPAQRLLEVSAVTVITAAGRPRYDLYLPATLSAANSVVSLVAASSYDGASFLALTDPVLQAMLGGQVTAATTVATPALPASASPLGPTLLIAGWLGTRHGLVVGRRP